MDDATHNPTVNNGIKDRLMVSKEGKKPVVYRDKQGNTLAEPFYDAGTVLVNEDSSIGLSSGSSKKDLTVQQVLESHQVAIKDLQTQILPSPGDNPGQDSDDQDHVDVVVGQGALYLEQMDGWDDAFATDETFVTDGIDHEISEYVILKDSESIDWSTKYRVANYLNPKFWIYFAPVDITSEAFLPVPDFNSSVDFSAGDVVPSNYPVKNPEDIVPFDEVRTATYRIGKWLYFWVGLGNGDVGPLIALNDDGYPYVYDEAMQEGSDDEGNDPDETEQPVLYQGYVRAYGGICETYTNASNFTNFMDNNVQGICRYNGYWYVYVDDDGEIGTYEDNRHYDKISATGISDWCAPSWFDASWESGRPTAYTVYGLHQPVRGTENKQWSSIKGSITLDDNAVYYYAERHYNKNLGYDMFGEPQLLTSSILEDIVDGFEDVETMTSDYLTEFQANNSELFSLARRFTALLQSAVDQAAASNLEVVLPANKRFLVALTDMYTRGDSGKIAIAITKPTRINLNGSTIQLATNWYSNSHLIEVAATAAGTTIKNGSILGDRDTHIRLPNTSSWGHNGEGQYNIYARCRIHLEDLKIGMTTGDAFVGLSLEGIIGNYKKQNAVSYTPSVGSFGNYCISSGSSGNYFSLSELKQKFTSYQRTYGFRRVGDFNASHPEVGLIDNVAEIDKFIGDNMQIFLGLVEPHIPDMATRVNSSYIIEYYRKDPTSDTYWLVDQRTCRFRDRGLPLYGYPDSTRAKQPTHVRFVLNMNPNDVAANPNETKFSVYGAVWNLNSTMTRCELFMCGRNGMDPNSTRNIVIDGCSIHDVYGTNNFVGIDFEGKSYCVGEIIIKNSRIYNLYGSSINMGYGEKITIDNCITGGVALNTENVEISNSTLTSSFEIKPKTPVNIGNHKNVVRNCKIIPRYGMTGASTFFAFNTVFENCLIEANFARAGYSSYAFAVLNVFRNSFRNCIIKGSMLPGDYSYCTIQRTNIVDSPGYSGESLLATNSYTYWESSWWFGNQIREGFDWSSVYNFDHCKMTFAALRGHSDKVKVIANFRNCDMVVTGNRGSSYPSKAIDWLGVKDFVNNRLVSKTDGIMLMMAPNSRIENNIIKLDWENKARKWFLTLVGDPYGSLTEYSLSNRIIIRGNQFILKHSSMSTSTTYPFTLVRNRIGVIGQGDTLNGGTNYHKLFARLRIDISDNEFIYDGIPYIASDGSFDASTYTDSLAKITLCDSGVFASLSGKNNRAYTGSYRDNLAESHSVVQCADSIKNNGKYYVKTIGLYLQKSASGLIPYCNLSAINARLVNAVSPVTESSTLELVSDEDIEAES